MQWITVLQACVPILVALVGIIPTIISNRKKTVKSIDEMKASITNVQKTLNTHIREDEDERARNQRARILRFYDEICEGRLHSESHFEDVLDDITDYETYCAKHPDFRNSRGMIAMDAIQDTYAAIKRKGGFLTHKEASA